jgi:hypothetical protein
MFTQCEVSKAHKQINNLFFKLRMLSALPVLDISADALVAQADPS